MQGASPSEPPWPCGSAVVVSGTISAHKPQKQAVSGAKDNQIGFVIAMRASPPRTMVVKVADFMKHLRECYGRSEGDGN